MDTQDHSITPPIHFGPSGDRADNSCELPTGGFGIPVHGHVSPGRENPLKWLNNRNFYPVHPVYPCFNSSLRRRVSALQKLSG
jgi:hypothetical protein